MSAKDTTGAHKPRLTLFRNFVPESEEEAFAPDRWPISSDVLYPILMEQTAVLQTLRQLDLMSESEFVGWARKRNVVVSGLVSKTDIDTFWKLGWLRADEVDLVARGLMRRHIEAPVPFQNILKIGEKPPSAG